MSPKEHDDDEKITASGWITIMAFVVIFCVMVWNRVQAGVPWWWAPVVAFVAIRCAIAIGRLDTKSLIVVALLGVATLVVIHVTG